jgi:hypothetical protein
MDDGLRREFRFLKGFALVSTMLWVIFVFTAFGFQRDKQRFVEIDAERINIVESDGQVKLVLANKDRLPDPGNIVTGKFTKREGLKTPGILFYNEKGDESGGLQFGSLEKGGRYGAGAGMSFDKYNGDQVIGIRLNDDNGKRSASFNVWDQPDATPEEQRRNYDEAHKLAPGPERDALLRNAIAFPRVFIGRSADQASKVTLYDADGRARIQMQVGADGDPKLEFLDAAGKVVQRIPASPGPR